MMRGGHRNGSVAKASTLSPQRSSSQCVLILTSEVAYVTHVRQNPSPVWSSSRNAWSDWSMDPSSTCPAQLEQEPARHEYGNSSPSSSAWSRMYTSSGHSNSWVPSGVSSVTLKCAATPFRAGTALTIPGAVPEASWAPTAARQPRMHRNRRGHRCGGSERLGRSQPTKHGDGPEAHQSQRKHPRLPRHVLKLMMVGAAGEERKVLPADVGWDC